MTDHTLNIDKNLKLDRIYLEFFYKLSLFVIPAKAGIQNVLKTMGRSPIRSRTSFTGMTKKNDYTIYGQTLLRYPTYNFLRNWVSFKGSEKNE